MADLTRPFDRALLALRLLAIDPAGLGGVTLRARAGPVRQAAVAALDDLPLPIIRLHPGMDDAALFGGVDLTATLAAGRLVQDAGLLSRPGALMLTMAERTAPALAARLAQVLDRGAGHCLIALDEGTDDEAPPAALADRLAFHIDLSDVALAGAVADAPPADLARPRPDGASVTADGPALEQIASLCARLEIASARAPVLTLRAARAHAALMGRATVAAEDILAAATLVLAHRARQMPEDAAAPDPGADRPPDQPPDPDRQTLPDTLPDDLILAAVAALIPADLLARLATGRTRAAKGSGTGDRQAGNRRGRPLPARPGTPGGAARIDLVATLRAAAPWQRLRAAHAPRPGVRIRPADLRLRRHESRSDRLLIFAVDASGSAAVARLAEAKGAVELLLAQAYARRDHVALIAFRGPGADLLLPPTRSLVQTRRRLAALPGGGGTPLAAGLRQGMDLAAQARGRGMTPTLVLLTDGRANIALDGSAQRPQAGADAERLARLIRAAGTPGLVIDTGTRPEPALRRLADLMAAPYLALPRADAGRLSRAVAAAVG